jgi:hypothetical protein
MTKMDRETAVSILTNQIQILAPKWHKYYVVRWDHYGLVRVTFCGQSACINTANIRSELEECWYQMWTYMEQIGVNTLNHRSSTKLIIPEYPNISRHFTITRYPYNKHLGYDYWFTIKIGIFTTHICYNADTRVMDELEAQLAVCAALAGSKIPVLIQYEIMAQFFGQHCKLKVIGYKHHEKNNRGVALYY